MNIPEDALNWRCLFRSYSLEILGDQFESTSPTPIHSPSTNRHLSSSTTLKSTIDRSTPDHTRSSQSNKLAAPSGSIGSVGFHRSLSSQSGGQGSTSWRTDHYRLLEVLAEWLVPPCLNFVRVECKSYGPVSEVALVRPILPLSLLLAESAHENSTSAKDRIKMGAQWSMASFIHALTACLAGALHPQFRVHFGDFMRRLVYGEVPGHPVPPSVASMGVPYPSEGSILDVMFDSKQRSLWKPWADYTKHVTLPVSVNAAKMLVTTPETIRYV